MGGKGTPHSPPGCPPQGPTADLSLPRTRPSSPPQCHLFGMSQRGTSIPSLGVGSVVGSDLGTKTRHQCLLIAHPDEGQPQGWVQHSHLHPTHRGDSRDPPARTQCLEMSWMKWKKLPSAVFRNLPGHVRKSKCKVCHPSPLLPRVQVCTPQPGRIFPLFCALSTHGKRVGIRLTPICQGHSSCPSLNFQTTVFI